MNSDVIRFDDGEAYERFMGLWSKRVGAPFLNWLAPKPGLRWLDVGCGNGAFTQMIIEHCAPSMVQGIDPSTAQIDFARQQPALRDARFSVGDAMKIPFSAGMFEIAVMPLVIFFVPDPLKGVQEMTRVVGGGGLVTAYAWDMPGGGFPYAALLSEMRAMNMPVPSPPNPDASRREVMQDIWSRAGLGAIETHEIAVERTFANFDEYWAAVQVGPSVAGLLKKSPQEESMRLKERLRSRFPVDAMGRITCGARANMVRGQVRG